MQRRLVVVALVAAFGCAGTPTEAGPKGTVGGSQSASGSDDDDTTMDPTDATRGTDSMTGDTTTIDPSLPSDPSDPSNPSDPSDPTDASDPTDVSATGSTTDSSASSDPTNVETSTDASASDTEAESDEDTMVGCQESDEPNQDIPGTSLPVATCGAAALEGSGILDVTTLPDLFRYDTIDPGCTTPIAQVEITSGGPITVCVREQCPGGGIGSGTCQAGQNSQGNWCCGTDVAAVSVECGEDDAAAIDVWFDRDDAQCHAFTFDYSF